MADPMLPATVRVPASTSNLGAGFDVVGLALDRYLLASYEPGSDALRVERTGTLRPLEAGEDDLVATAFRRRLGIDADQLQGTLHLDSGIPVARGLGSSAAAVVAGYDLALAVRGAAPDPNGAFLYATAAEGHGDNAAPCALGGLRAVLPTSPDVSAISLELSPDIGFVYAAPSSGSSTAEARRVLPGQIAHGTAVGALGRLAALLAGLANGDPELLRIGVDDHLHVPYRLPSIPGGGAAVEAGYGAGAWAVTISGAGSGLIAMCAHATVDAVRASMGEALQPHSSGDVVSFVARPDTMGMTRPAQLGS